MRRSRVRWPLISLCGAFVWLLITLSPFVELRAATEERVFVDSSRPTRENGSFPGAPDRTLRTLIWVPSGPCGGPESCPPFPLFLMAHGFGGLPEKFEAFASTIAEAGYVVASPAFPLTNADAPGGHLTGFTDHVNQPEDLAFVTGELVLASSSMTDSLFGLIDPNTTAVLGHSLGGVSVLALAHSDCCQLLPLQAAVLVDTFAGLTPGNLIQTGPTTLVLHGTEDPTVPFASAFDLLATLPKPRYLVGIDGAGHSEQLESQVEPPIPARATAQLATAAFLNAQIRGAESEFEDVLTSLAGDGHVVVVELVPPIPTLPTWALTLFGALLLAGSAWMIRVGLLR